MSPVPVDGPPPPTPPVSSGPTPPVSSPPTPPLPGPEEVDLLAGPPRDRHEAVPVPGLAAEIERVVEGRSRDPHTVLGAHDEAGRLVVRAWLPGTVASVAVTFPEQRVEATEVHPAGLWEADAGPVGPGPAPRYRLIVTRGDGGIEEREDPYRFWPTVGDLDLYLFGEGRHESLWRVLGAHPMLHQGVGGVAFAVWAPNARAVRVVGEWNAWDGRAHPMRIIGRSGIWELFVPAATPGQLYKYEVVGADGVVVQRADPFASEAELAPGTASRVHRSAHVWADEEWLERRRATGRLDAPFSVYEVHLGSWRHGEGDRELTYREVGPLLADYVCDLGFTHVELMAIAEHPYGGSWGYQVTSYFAPTSRHGAPDDFRCLVDELHQRGIGVIVDWVPAHFPRDAWALARFDGTPLYEHADPRRGEHPDWGTLVFNLGRHEVANFVMASAQAWVEEFHIDGVRVDAVASMLYLDYSRQEGEWVPNSLGGRENLETVAFFQRFNELMHARYDGVVTIAEESTAWPGVSRPVYTGGLGFTFKWNMGWMHDTLDYFSLPTIYRRFHHDRLTFGLLYAFAENFVLPLSHDEVVHEKGSLLAKMPGDRWQQMANLRALLAWMWAHPGRQLLFMGGEIAQEREWSHERSIDWELLALDSHRGVQDLVRTLNQLMHAQPALWELDFDAAGFHWVEADDADHNVVAFVRTSSGRAEPVVCVANLSPVVRRGYRLGVPRAGTWAEILSTDAPVFGGGGVLNGARAAEAAPWHGFAWSIDMVLPPLGVVWLAPAGPVPAP